MTFGSEQWMYSSGGFYPLEIGQSCRFNGGQELQRVVSVAGDTRTWTWSGWIKFSRVPPSATYFAIWTARPTATRYVQLQLGESGTIGVFIRNSGTAYAAVAAPLIRDPAGWYHVVLTVDTTEAVASDRIKLYFNGELAPWTGTPTFPALNDSLPINDTTAQTIGYLDYLANTNSYLEGYLCEVNHIDGQALDPTDFGEFKSGVWVAKEYTGTYGTNGFRLDFGNGAALGTDVSGQGNDYTPSGLDANDQMLDTPTNNFATMNPVALASLGSLSQGNLAFSYINNASATYAPSAASFGIPKTGGKWYFEVGNNLVDGNNAFIVGIVLQDEVAAGSNANTATEFACYRSTGNASADGYTTAPATAPGGGSSFSGKVLGIAIDMDNGTFDAYLDNALVTANRITGIDTTKNWIVGVMGWEWLGTAARGTFNFGQDSSFAGALVRQGNQDANGQGDFYYAPPAGYLALCSANLPDPIAVIDPAQDASPQDFFNTILWTGNSQTAPQSITGIGFQPDFIWAKQRASTNSHQLTDVVRGTLKGLHSNTTDVENTFDAIRSFDSDGFTIGTSATVNAIGAYVAWNWKMGGAAVANTDGTITSQVSANPDLGMSVVSYTGTAVAATLGHGIGKAPDLIIVKCRSATAAWYVYNSQTAVDPATDYLVLNTSAALLDNSSVWNDTEPTDSVFSIGNGVSTNAIGQDYIAYAFASVEGFSKIGTYTGNGSADGPFVYCGFRPAYILTKRTSSSGSWYVFDDTRNPNNIVDKQLYPNLTNAEADIDTLDILSNGFKIRSTASEMNQSGQTILFMAFAENPFKYANAR